MPYTPLHWGWEDCEPAVSLSDGAFRLLPHLIANRLMNRAGLYQVSLQMLAAIARMTVEEVREAMAELVERQIVLYDEDTRCLFIVDHISDNYVKEGQLKKDKSTKGLLIDLRRCVDMSLYPKVLRAYPDLAELVPPPRSSPKALLNGEGGQEQELAFDPGPPPAPPARHSSGDGGKVTEAEQKYLALRERVKPALVKIYDGCAAIMQEHSKQPRKANDFRGRADDLRAIRKVAEDTKDIVEHVLPALKAVYVDRREEMQYFTSGNGRIDTIRGLAAKWSDGTMKAVGLVNRHLACRDRYEASDAERAEELRRLKAEYRELQTAPGVTDAELADARAQIANLAVGSEDIAQARREGGGE